MRSDAREAVRRLRAGDREGARAAVEAVVAAAPVLGARLLAVAGQDDRALRVLRDVSARGGAAAALARRQAYAIALRVRFYEEAHEQLDAIAAASPRDGAAAAARTLLYRRLGHWDGAARAMERALALGVGREIEQARNEIARHARRADLAGAPDEDGLRALAACGRFAELDARAAGVEGAAWRARLALWAGRTDEAEALARAVPAHPHAARVIAVAALLRGRHEEARRALDAIVARDPDDDEARLWRAEARKRAGDAEGARRDVQWVRDRIADHLPAKIMAALLAEEGRDVPQLARETHEGLIEGQLAALGVRLPEIVGSSALRDACRDALARLGANRSALPTRARDDGSLLAIEVPPSARYRARRAQHTVRWAGIAGAREALGAELSDELASHPIALCYAGELELWAEDAAAARAIFERVLAIDARTTWGWVGLSASEVLAGDAAGALRTIERLHARLGRVPPSLPVVHGEALLALGRTSEAITMLERAARAHPERIAARVLLAIAHASAGDDAARDAVLRALESSVPAFVADARDACAPDEAWSREVPAGSIERVLASMRALLAGNRSSSCAFWVRRGKVRSLIADRPVRSAAWERDELAAIERALAGARGR